jgi:DNA-binding NarL/FixJ family response regulator
MTLVDRGDPAAARAVLVQHRFDDDIPDGAVSDILWFARGYLRAAEGDASGALDDILQYGEISSSLMRRNPAHWPWRSTAAHLLAQQRRFDEARELAQHELELALATGNADAIAVARAARGVAEPGPGGLSLLAEAVAHLEDSPLLLIGAEVQAIYGRELRIAGHREQARDVLRVALDAATRMGAARVADEAQRELLSAGARPRRTTMTGLDALTPSERRVASLAARGLTNRELAHTLYVTPKTVEAHLASAYRKLGINGKAALAAFFGEAAPGI